MNLKELLFNPAWWMLLIPFLVGIPVWWSGNKRLDKTISRIGLVLLALGVIWVIVSYAVDTDEEKVERDTRQFVAAVVKRDWATVDRLLHDKASLALWNKRDILNGAKEYVDFYGVQGARIISMQIEDHENEISASFTVLSDHDPQRATTPMVNSSWQFDWWATADGWKLKTITPLRIGDRDTVAAQETFFSERRNAR